MPSWTYQRIFRRWRPKRELRPQGRVSDPAVTVRWLGTAGYLVDDGTTRVLLDPYLSRPGLWRVATRPLRPDEAEIRAAMPSKVDGILLGHSHFDHLLDAPLIAKWTGARIVGSATTAAFARASGVPEEKIETIPPEGRELSIGTVQIRYVPSRHGRLFAGRVPFPGEVKEPPSLPARVGAYKMGGAFGVLLKGSGWSLYHNGSADLIDAELENERADVLLVGLAGRKSTPDYLGRLTRLLEPGLVVPTHHDAFFAPLSEGVFLLPKIDLEGFVSEARHLTPDSAIITPGYLEDLAIPAHAPRDAKLTTAGIT